MELGQLYAYARSRDIAVIPYPMAQCGSMSVMDGTGRCYIGMDSSTCDGGVQERTHLLHELGHCETGSFYRRETAVDSRRRHENRADKWAIAHHISAEALDEAVAGGCTQIWELAEHFGVTEEFMRKAVCYYVYGNVAAELYF